MASEARAFAPANISCIFRIYRHKSPRWMGSYGVGFTVNKGVIANASKSNQTEVAFNGVPINFPTVRSVIKKLTKDKVTVRVRSGLPLGCGFGLSGASALAAAYAVNRLLKLKKTRKELAVIAHTAEVENRTGLGDVVNQYYGGFCLKLKPSSRFIIKRIPINNADVYCRHFSAISTKSVITSQKLRGSINKAASVALAKIRDEIKTGKRIKFGEIIRISREFAENSGLLKDKATMQSIADIEKNNCSASMIMLGNAVFSDSPFKGAVKLKISSERAHLLRMGIIKIK